MNGVLLFFRNYLGIIMTDKQIQLVKIYHPFYNLMAIIMATITSMIGYHIHQSLFWAIVDWCFFPLAWIKWLICEEVSMKIIRETFSFFFN
jgi:hypothetical protein